MDSVLLIVAIAVVAYVSWWYAVNEARGSGGDFGLLAIGEEADEAAGANAAPKKGSPRYRQRERLTPTRRGGEENGASKTAQQPTRAYRVKERKADKDRSTL